MGVLNVLHSSATEHWTGSIRDALVHRVSYLTRESSVELFLHFHSFIMPSNARVFLCL